MEFVGLLVGFSGQLSDLQVLFMIQIFHKTQCLVKLAAINSFFSVIASRVCLLKVAINFNGGLTSNFLFFALFCFVFFFKRFQHF